MNKREKYTAFYFQFLIIIFVLLPVLGMKNPDIPDNPAKNNPMEIMAFYTEAEDPLPSSFSSLSSNAKNISYISPFYYKLTSDGSLEKWDGVSQDKVDLLVSYARQRDVKVLALVHNLLYGEKNLGKKLAHKVLKNYDSREKFVNDTFDLVSKAGFDGVMLDIEDINYEDRDNFSALVKQMKQTFAPHDLTVAVSVPPETGALIPGSWAVNFDYKAIGRWADRVVIMAYDEHGYSTKPGPIASQDWVENVLDYSCSVISRDKIILGVPTYGFDWNAGKKAPKYLSFDLARKLANENGEVPVFNQTHGAPSFSYSKDGQKHETWYEDVNSFKVKAEIVEKRGLRGLAIWRLGMEDPEIWRYLDSEIQVRK